MRDKQLDRVILWSVLVVVVAVVVAIASYGIFERWLAHLG